MGPQEIIYISIILTMIIWLFALVDVLRNEFTGNNKLIWILVVLLGSIVGGTLYLFIGRKQRVINTND